MKTVPGSGHGVFRWRIGKPQILSHRLIGDFAVPYVQAGAQMHVAAQRLLPPQLGNPQRMGQRDIVERTTSSTT